MKTKTELQKFIEEAKPIQSTWRENAKEYMKIYSGDQWPAADKAELEEQQRPVLTFNVLRPLVRLLCGMEMKSRYDIKVMPTGGGADSDIATLLSTIQKDIETDNKAQYIYSQAYRSALVTGRGWVKVDVNYDRNIWGDISIEEIDSYEIIVDPYTRKPDLSDSRYLIRELFLTKDEIIALYPQLKNKIDKLEVAAPDYADTISQARETYKLYEVWYREYIDHYYIVRKDTGDVALVEDKKLKETKAAIANSGNNMIELRKYTRPEMYYAVMGGPTEVLEQGKSPYVHNFFPYVPVFIEFVPRFGSIKPRWDGFIADLVDPQMEKNKRRSLYTDILLRFINKGFYYEEGAVANEDELDQWGRAPGFKVKLSEGKFDRFKIIEGSAPDVALLNLDALSDQDIQRISSVYPDMYGQQQSSREAGRTVMLRQQQGATSLAPYNDNMRMMREMVARQILALIQQIYTVGRMVRMVTDSGHIDKTKMSPDDMQKLQTIILLKNDITIGRYDIAMSEVPSTPTTRQTEFVELLELVKQGVLPLTPNISEILIKASDISLKNDILSILKQEMAQQQQQQQQAQVQKALLGK